MARILARTIDGARRVVMTCSSFEEALEFLRRWADEAHACGYRRVRLDEIDGILFLAFSRDDDVVYYIDDEE